MKCELCKYYDANKDGFLPLCRRFSISRKYGQKDYHPAIDVRKFECKGEHFEVSQPELKLAQEEMIIDYWSN